MANRLDPSAQFALVAAREAWADAGSPEVDPDRFAVDFATGIGGLQTTLERLGRPQGEGPSPHHADEHPDAHAERAGSRHLDAPAGPRVRAHRGVGVRLEHRGGGQRLRDTCALATPTSSSPAVRGDHPPLDARRVRGMQALSKRNDSPETASRPYSVDRDGFVMGEGGACLVIETEEHAKARGAKIYAEVVGGGVTADSYHITAPEPEGLGASRAVRQALEQAGATPDDVTHINAHATSTPTGDIAEYRALLSVFGDRLHEIPVSATKGPPVTSWAARAPSRRSSPSSRCASVRRRRRSTCRRRIPRSRFASRARRSRSAMARSSRSATRSGSAATTPSSAFRSV